MRGQEGEEDRLEEGGKRYDGVGRVESHVLGSRVGKGRREIGKTGEGVLPGNRGSSGCCWVPTVGARLSSWL